MAKIGKSTLDKTLKFFLRAIPVIPVPELLEVFKDITDSKDSINRKIEVANSSLKKSFVLIEELQKELKEKADTLNELKNKYEEYLNEAESQGSKTNALTTKLLDRFTKKNLVDITKLKTEKNFGKIKNISRQQINKLSEAKNIDVVNIDGINFVLLNEKTEGVKPKE